MYFVLRVLNHPVVVELRRPAGSRELVPARPGDNPIAGMLVLRIEGGLCTLNVHGVQTEIYNRFEALEPRPEVVLLDVGATVDTSVTVMDVLFETDQHLSRQGSTLWIAALPTWAEVKARRTKVWPDWVARQKIHATVRDAVDVHETITGPEDEPHV
jgi:MFS superfamily sulfate permease-like transporter